MADVTSGVLCDLGLSLLLERVFISSFGISSFKFPFSNLYWTILNHQLYRLNIWLWYSENQWTGNTTFTHILLKLLVDFDSNIHVTYAQSCQLCDALRNQFYFASSQHSSLSFFSLFYCHHTHAFSRSLLSLVYTADRYVKFNKISSTVTSKDTWYTQVCRLICQLVTQVRQQRYNMTAFEYTVAIAC